MFDGMQPGDQLHQFIASSRTSLPINPLSFPNPTLVPSFDPFSSHQLHLQLESSVNHKVELEHEEQRERSMLETTISTDPGWSNNEILALLRIRSNIEDWFSDFTWEHVSRKLAELGFKRTAYKCKEKFEEESRNFNSISYSKNYRSFSEHEDEFYPDDQHQEPRISIEKNQQNQEKDHIGERNIVEGESERTVTAITASQENEEQVAYKPRENKKRKRRGDKFEMFKGFCEKIVNEIMVQQEELHNKLIEDMSKRDEEKSAREEAWKNRHMERIKKEIETRAEEQATAGERQAIIIEFLKKFVSDSCEEDQQLVKKLQDLLNVNVTLPSTIKPQDQSPTTQEKVEATTSSSMAFIHQIPSTKPSSSYVIAQNPNSENTQENNQLEFTLSSRKNPSKNLNFESGDTGNRWPRDEVLALINLRCKLNNNNEIKEGSKGPLWERISKGMVELGYKRSPKRCKEKWENINKYFRKTKDSSKQRSIDSRTCPYFQQLSSLYSQGTLVAPDNVPANQ